MKQKYPDTENHKWDQNSVSKESTAFKLIDDEIVFDPSLFRLEEEKDIMRVIPTYHF